MANIIAVEGGFGVSWLAGLMLGPWSILAVALGALASALRDGVTVQIALLTAIALSVEATVGWLTTRVLPWLRGIDNLKSVVALVLSGLLASLLRGILVWMASAGLAIDAPSWQGTVAFGVAFFSNALAAAVGVAWRGTWRVSFGLMRILELVALVVLTLLSGHLVFGGPSPYGLNLPFPIVTWLIVLHTWTLLRFHAQGLAIILAAWYLVFDLHASARGTFDPAIPLSEAPTYQFLLFLTMGIVIAVELAVAAVATQLAADAADNARLNSELLTRNAELEVGAINLAREHAFLDAVLAQLPAGVMIVAPDGKILRRNARHERLWRLRSRGEQLDQLGSGSFSLSNNRRVPYEDWPIVRAVLRGESTEGFEARLVDPSDTSAAIDVSIGATPVFDQTGNVIGAVSIMTDVTERKATLASLRESEQRFRIALQAARMITYEWDTATLRFRSAVPLIPWLGLSGIPEPNSLVGLLAIVHPEDADGLRRAVDKIVAGSLQCEIEFRVLRSSGEVIRLLCRSSRVTEADGRPTDRMVGIIMDVTDRHRNENRLRLLESAVVHARDAIVILESEPEHGPGRSVLYANSAFCELTGYTLDEILGRSLHFLRGPNSDPATLERLRDALDLGISFQGELLNYRKDGSDFWVELSVVPVPDRAGRCAHFVMIQRDVSDRRRAEDELRHSEQMLAEAQSIAHIGSWEFEPNRDCFRWSAEEFRIFGRDPEAFEPMLASVLGCIHPEDRLQVQSLFFEPFQHTARQNYDYRIVRPTGEIRYVRDQIQPEYDGEGRLHRLNGVTHDVTESRQTQEQLVQAQKMELIGQLAGGIAHDFNNILTAIIGNLARVELPPDDSNRAMVQVALSAAGRAADLTRKLLGFARRHQLLLAPVLAADFVEEVVELVGHSFDPRICLNMELDRGLAVSADSTLMSQVLLNLCINAKDAMPQGGTLSLRVFHGSVTPPEDCRPGPYVCISVEDTGQGIPPEVMGHLFEPFFTTKPVGKGTGLGLAMVHGIMRQHGGWVECRSEVGVGTCFDLYLPFVPNTTPIQLTPSVSWGAATAPRSNNERPSDRPATILLVDDEELIRLLGRSVLESSGYRVLEAADGEQAVEEYRKQADEIDLVILDLTMPRMSGQDAFRLIAESHPSVRVLLSSGFTPDGLADTEGILGLLPKPYRPAELLDAVGIALKLSPNGKTKSLPA